MDTGTAAKRWADAWSRGWATLDPSFASELYAPAAAFVPQPFRPAEDPVAFVSRAFAEEEWADPWFGEPIVEDDRAAVEWYARMNEDGRDVTISGVSLLRFDTDGRCVEQRDTWVIVDGLVER